MTPESRSSKGKITLSRKAGHWLLIAFGFLNVGLGVIGVFVPGLPTTVFLIIALWAFSKSSERFQKWLWHHHRFGPSLQAWHNHRVIPLKAKILAVATMTLSLLYLTFFVAESWVLPTSVAAIMVPVALYLLTRNSAAPDASD
jgi:uncharacterized protein